MKFQSKSMRHDYFFAVAIPFLVELVFINIKYEAMFPNGKLKYLNVAWTVYMRRTCLAKWCFGISNNLWPQSYPGRIIGFT